MRKVSDAQRYKIIECSTPVFLSNGYTGASMDDIARKVGCSKVTLYNYFPSKEDLFSAVLLTFGTGSLIQAINTLCQPQGESLSLEVKLTRFATSVFQGLVKDTRALELYRLVLGEAGKTDLGSLFYKAGPEQLVIALTEVMHDHMITCELNATDPALRARQFMALLRVGIEYLLLDPCPAPLTEEEVGANVYEAVSLFLNGASVTRAIEQSAKNRDN